MQTNGGPRKPTEEETLAERARNERRRIESNRRIALATLTHAYRLANDRLRARVERTEEFIATRAIEARPEGR